MGTEVAHSIPGRIRLRASELKSNPALADQIRQRIEALQGTERVEVRPRTCSIIVYYDEDVPDRYLASLGGVFPDLEPGELKPRWQPSSNGAPHYSSSGAATVAAFFDRLNSRVEERTGGTDLAFLIPFALFLLGAGKLLRDLIRSKQIPTPDWYDYFWFALGTFFMLNEVSPDSESDGKDDQE